MARSFSDLFIAMVLVSFFVVSLVIIIGEGSNHFSVTTFNQSEFEIYNQTASIYNLTKDIESQTNFSSSSGVFDIIGSLFSQGYSAMKLGTTSITTFNAMQNKAVQEAQLGPLTPIFSMTIATIILIIVFVAILLRYVIKEKT